MDKHTVTGFMDELEKLAVGTFYTGRQVKMLESLPGGYPTELDEEEEAVTKLKQTPEWQREEAVANVGTIPVLGGLTGGAIGGAIGGFKAGRYIGMPLAGALAGFYGGGIAGAKGGYAIRQKMLDRARKKYDAQQALKSAEDAHTQKILSEHGIGR